MTSLSLLSAGSNARGQLATGNIDDAHHFSPCVFHGNPAGTLPDHIAEVEQIACGSNHTLALLRTWDGATELWGSGDGSRGQLGPSYVADVGEVEEDAAIFRPLDLQVEDSRTIEGFTVRLVAAGWETSYIVLSRPEHNDVLLSMGANDFGNLGIGGSFNLKATISTSNNRICIVDLHTILSCESVPPDSTMSILSLSAGPHHTVAHVSYSHTQGSSQTYLMGWGTSRHGQLGSILEPSGRPLRFTSSPHLVPLPSPEDIRTIALGNQHTICLYTSGNVTGLGSNRKNQLDGIDAICDVEEIGCTWNGTYALLRSGGIIATGSNSHSQLGRGLGSGSGTDETQDRFAKVRFPFGPAPGQISRLACGSEHVLCIVDINVVHEGDDGDGDGDGEDEPGGGREPPRRGRVREVWGWGWNEHGNLGTGGTMDVSVATRIWPPPPSTPTQAGVEDESHVEVVNVWAGCGTSWILVRR